MSLLARFRVSEIVCWTKIRMYIQYVITIIVLLATVNVDQKNDKGWTALMFAARHGQTGVIETLLEKG